MRRALHALLASPQNNFAIRARMGDGMGDVMEDVTTTRAPPSTTHLPARMGDVMEDVTGDVAQRQALCSRVLGTAPP